MKRIVIIEDDAALNHGIAMALKRDDLTFGQCFRLGDYRENEKADLIILDVNLPDGNGFDFLKKLRQSSRVPVIMLTANDLETDEVRGLELGADDYVIKPFRNRELVSRIKSVLRRAMPEEDGREKELKCGEIRLNPETGKVYAGGKEIALTKLEFRILSSMMAHPGKIFTREEILAGVWDLYGNYVNDNTLSVTMKRIREKLGDPGGERIKTIRGVGYRLEK